MSKTQTPRPQSNLENDDEYCCKECGIKLPIDAVFFYGYERCPECELKETKRELEAIFGTLNSVEASPVFCPEEHRCEPPEDAE